MTPEANRDGLAAARRYAQWHIGDPTWADAILNAYNHPTETIKALNEERDSWENEA